MNLSRRVLLGAPLLTVAAELLGCAPSRPLNSGYTDATYPSSRGYTSLGFEELARENPWMYDAVRSVGFIYDVDTKHVDPNTHRASASAASSVLIDSRHLVSANHALYTWGQFFARFRNPDGGIERRFKVSGGDKGVDDLTAELEDDRDTNGILPARVSYDVNAISYATKVIAIGWIDGPNGKSILHAAGTRSPEDILHRILPTTRDIFTKGEPLECVILAKMQLVKGMSGGGLFSNGELVGVTKAMAGEIGIFTPIEHYTARLYGSAPPPGCPDPRFPRPGYAPG